MFFRNLFDDRNGRRDEFLSLFGKVFLSGRKSQFMNVSSKNGHFESKMLVLMRVFEIDLIFYGVIVNFL